MIEIRFNNTNSAGRSIIEVFKSHDDIDPLNPPPVYATLSGDANTFRDSDVVLHETYKYRLKVSRPGRDFSWSDQIVQTYTAMTGPGELVPVTQYKNGYYYGLVEDTTRLPTVEAIYAAAKSDAIIPAGLTNKFIKVSVAGNMYYVPLDVFIDIRTCNVTNKMNLLDGSIRITLANGEIYALSSLTDAEYGVILGLYSDDLPVSRGVPRLSPDEEIIARYNRTQGKVVQDLRVVVAGKTVGATGASLTQVYFTNAAPVKMETFNITGSESIQLLPVLRLVRE